MISMEAVPVAPDELLLALASGSANEVERRFIEAHQAGVFERWFPEFGRLADCYHDPRSHREGAGCALIHVAKVFARAAGLSGVGEGDRLVLLVAALLHDVKKPQTRTVDESGVVSFREHDTLAAECTPELVAPLGLSESQSNAVQWLVLHHMTAHRIPQMRASRRLQFYRHPLFPLLSLLQSADARCIWLSDDGSEHAEILQEYYARDGELLAVEEAAEQHKTNLLKRVNVALTRRGIKPGPIYRTIGEALLAAHEREGLLSDESISDWMDRVLATVTPHDAK